MDVGFKPRKLLIEVAGEFQVLDDRAVETLAGNQERNAGRIRRQQHARHASFQIVDVDAIDFAMRHARERVRRLHCGLQVGQIHLGRHARDVVRLVGIVDLLA